MNVSAERIEFESQGERLIGALFWPQVQPSAAVVLTGPVTSVKEQASGEAADAIAGFFRRALE